MFSSLFQPCTVKLHVLQNVLFLSPPVDSHSVPSDDPLIRGVLEVHSPSDRVIAGIEIKLRALQSVSLIDSGMHTGTEDSVVFEKNLILGVEGPESSGSLSSQTRSPSPTYILSNTSNDDPTHQDITRFSSEGSSTSRPSSLRRRSTAGSNAEGSTGIFLSKGVHGFEFSILLPSSSPPYERSTYGRVVWTLSATAVGAGRAKTNLSIERPMYPVVNPNPEGGPVVLSTGYHDLASVGLLSADFSSDNLCVGGGLSIDVRSPEPMKGITIHLVKVCLESNVELETKKNGIQKMPKRQKVLFQKGYVDPQHPKDVGQGDKKDGVLYQDSNFEGKRDWAVNGIVKLPNDDVIRPTTLSGSMAAIRWSHNLLLQVVYSFPDSSEDSGLKVFSVRNKVLIPSCCASHEAVRLPQYQASAAPTSLPLNSLDSSTTSPPPLLPDSPWAYGGTVLWGPRLDFCVCGQSLASLESSIIPRRTNDAETPIDRVRMSKIEDCSCPNSPSTPPYSASTLSSSSATTSTHTSAATRRPSVGPMSSRVSVEDSFGIPSLDLSSTQRSRSLGYDTRQRSVELDGDPPTYDCAVDGERRGRET